ncbi:YvcK family protein [Patescibacteria group bacterium]|nr:YvcK family protein [Patescibacteria group bacterium]MBU1029049.1 YvcK family protein [Patescibacteria group bacterium]MBU1915946.1 YvcK family protein [Patescibacteria group bacterium]
MRDIVTIGGGTGQFMLLSGLKRFPVRLTAVVSMADDGGSTGMLRDELGVLPPGDIRQCLVALSESELVMRELFNYRFDKGKLEGHNFGNIFLSALEKITGSFEEAVRVAGLVLSTRGSVIPVTTTSISLVCGSNGELRGEHIITENSLVDRSTLRLEPEAYANPKAVAAIESAECLIIGPGNLYCSIIPNLLVQGISEAISRSSATVVYNCNLMTKAGHTDSFGVVDFVREIEQYIGAGRIDYVTYNDRMPNQELLDRYALEGEYFIQPLESGEVPGLNAKPLAAPLLWSGTYVQKSGDPIKRTLIRHDPDILATLIIRNCLRGL